MKVYQDAVIVEQAVINYCEDNTCYGGNSIRYFQLEEYLPEDFNDDEYYDLTNNMGIVAKVMTDGVAVDLEASGTGNLEYPQGSIPSIDFWDVVTEDED